jgi:hypothetical protein
MSKVSLACVGCATTSKPWKTAVDEKPWTLTDYSLPGCATLARQGSGAQLNPPGVAYMQQRTNIRPVSAVSAARSTLARHAM